MRTHMSSFLFVGAVLAARLDLIAPAQENKPATSKPSSAERTILVTVTAKVEAIDQDKREVTLKGPMGNMVTSLWTHASSA